MLSKYIVGLFFVLSVSISLLFLVKDLLIKSEWFSALCPNRFIGLCNFRLAVFVKVNILIEDKRHQNLEGPSP